MKQNKLHSFSKLNLDFEMFASDLHEYARAIITRACSGMGWHAIACRHTDTLHEISFGRDESHA